MSKENDVVVLSAIVTDTVALAVSAVGIACGTEDVFATLSANMKTAGKADAALILCGFADEAHGLELTKKKEKGEGFTFVYSDDATVEQRSAFLVFKRLEKAFRDTYTLNPRMRIDADGTVTVDPQPITKRNPVISGSKGGKTEPNGSDATPALKLAKVADSIGSIVSWIAGMDPLKQGETLALLVKGLTDKGVNGIKLATEAKPTKKTKPVSEETGVKLENNPAVTFGPIVHTEVVSDPMSVAA